MGVHDFWDPAYWTPEGYRQRKEEERNSAQKLAVEQDNSKRDTWGAIGKGIGDAANWAGQSLGQGGLWAAKNTVPLIAGITPASRNPSRTNLGDPSDDISAQEFGDARQTNLDWGFKGPEESESDRILKRLGERFTFDGSTADTSALDAMFQQNKGVLDGLRSQTNDNFQTSDRNVAAMHEAFRKDQLAQAPRIQQEGDRAKADVEGIFNKSIGDSDRRQSDYQAKQAEMFQRLGIAPAANQPDIVSAELQSGINDAQKGRDVRSAAIASGTQTNLANNSGMASAIGNEGNQRRSELNMRLQEVLGNIGAKEADFQNDYQRQKMELQNNAEDQAYQRWIQDRQFDMGLFDSINQNNQRMAEAQGKAQTQGAQGIDGLMGQTSPAMRAAAADVGSKVNIGREPEKAMKMLQDPKYGLTPEEVFIWISKYGNLGTTNKFPTAE